MMLSFVVLSDGRHDYQSFRPKEDHSQWWSRRDALVRIANVCCFDGPGVYNGITKEIIYIFNDTKTNDTFEKKEEKKNIGVVIIDGEKMHKEVHIPTENEILQTFRNALKSCKEVLNKASFTSEPLQSVESFEIKMDKNNESVSSNLSKKEMISIMQQRAPLEFLRKFHLNGSLELVLKKINKNKLDEAYSEFIAASSQSEYNPLLLLFKGIFQRLRTSNPVTSSKNNDNNKSNKKRKLEELNLSSSGDMISSYQTIVLLLHEDYPDELPVFRQMIEAFPRNIHVVCILGAVRDITNEETMAIFQSCINLQIPCVGANLGRVAEFTSKIIATMVNHAKSGALFKAIHLLPDLTKNPIDSSILEKLPSIRKGHITWDGHQESQNKEKAEINLDSGKHHEQQPQSSQLRHHEFYTVIRVFLSTEEVLQHAAETIASQDKDDDYFEDRKKFHPLIQMIISTMWKSRFGSSTKTTAAAEEDVEEVENISSSNVENILFIVFENNRIIILKEREIQKQIREYHLSAPNEYQILQLLKRLILQSSTSLEIASSPSISSISYEMNALITIFDYETRESNKLSRKELKNRKEKELFCVNLLHSFRIGNPINIPPPTTVIEEDEKNSVISFQTQFLPKVYNESCQCGQITRDGDHDHTAATIWLFFGFDSIHTELFSTGLLFESIFRWKYAYRNSQDTTKRTVEDDDDSSKRQKKLKKISKRCLTIDTAPPSSSVVMAPAILVTLFQHFAYHDRLVPSLAQR